MQYYARSECSHSLLHYGNKLLQFHFDKSSCYVGKSTASICVINCYVMLSLYVMLLWHLWLSSPHVQHVARLWAQSPILTSLLHTLFFDWRVFLFRISNMAMVNWLYGVTLRHVKHQLVFQLQRQSLIVLNVCGFITTIRNTLF